MRENGEWTRNCRCSQFKMIQYPVAKIFSNGRIHFFLRCQKCQVVEGPVLKDTITAWGYDLEKIPVIEDFRNNVSCERCGEPYAEYHHWMPVHIKDREYAETWPKGWLCTSCHREWHKQVTPDMIKKGKAKKQNGHH